MKHGRSICPQGWISLLILVLLSESIKIILLGVLSVLAVQSFEF